MTDGTGRNDGTKLEKKQMVREKRCSNNPFISGNFQSDEPIKHELFLYWHLEFPSERARVVEERGWGLD